MLAAIVLPSAREGPRPEFDIPAAADVSQGKLTLARSTSPLPQSRVSALDMATVSGLALAMRDTGSEFWTIHQPFEGKKMASLKSLASY
jgi:hypothetical protein